MHSRIPIQTQGIGVVFFLRERAYAVCAYGAMTRVCVRIGLSCVVVDAYASAFCGISRPFLWSYLFEKLR